MGRRLDNQADSKIQCNMKPKTEPAKPVHHNSSHSLEHHSSEEQPVYFANDMRVKR
jgi:hypothetical protein